MYPKAADYTSFSSAHKTLQNRSHPEWLSKLEKYKKTEIVLSIFYDNNAMWSDMNYRKQKQKYMEASQCRSK